MAHDKLHDCGKHFWIVFSNPSGSAALMLIRLHTNRVGENIIILIVYFDCILLTESCRTEIGKVPDYICNQFTARIGNGLSNFLGMVIQDTI